MTTELDTSLYTTAPQFTLSGGITVARSLIKLTPKSAAAPIKKASKNLTAVADAAQAAFVQRQRELGVVSEETAKLVDHEADLSWAALHGRLASYALLPVERFPKAARAGELVVNLFGAGGLDFLKIRYDEQFTMMDSKLKRIKEDGFAAEINELAGPEFLDQVQNVNPRYEAMVHGRLQKDSGSGENLSNHVRALQKAMVDYAIKVLATADQDEPATITNVQTILRPMETLREHNARRTTPSQNDTSGSTGESGTGASGSTSANALAAGDAKPAEAAAGQTQAAGGAAAATSKAEAEPKTAKGKDPAGAKRKKR